MFSFLYDFRWILRGYPPLWDDFLRSGGAGGPAAAQRLLLNCGVHFWSLERYFWRLLALFVDVFVLLVRLSVNLGGIWETCL